MNTLGVNQILYIYILADIHMYIHTLAIHENIFIRPILFDI